MEEEYSFDLQEIEKKPYRIGGYAEFRPAVSWLDKDAALYALRFYDRDEGDSIEEYNLTLQLDGSYEKGMARLTIKTNSDLKKTYLGWEDRIAIFEGYLSLKPFPSLNIDIGKKTLKWGKGYIWTPSAFLDRTKNPNDPDLALEGYVVASADYIKSFDGPLKTLSFTPVLIPVYDHLNDDFGKTGSVNFASRLYLLLYDTDIDCTFMTGGSKTLRYGLDFSRNILPNFEIHGEFGFISDFEKKIIDVEGMVIHKKFDAKSYLIGLRYLTELNTTIIAEYYHDGTGLNEEEMEIFFSTINRGYELFLNTGDNSLFKQAENLGGTYERMNSMKDYLYLRMNQKEPFNILYFTPAITWMLNIQDRSFSLSPEILYIPVTNLELRGKFTLLTGPDNTEYGERQNDYRMELRIRYYF